MTRVCTSGYFNPIHKGHLKLIEEAAKLGDHLTVIVNNDRQVELKGSKLFMNEEERCEIVRAIKWVDEVVLSVDNDKTVRETLIQVHPHIFAKGGDSTHMNVPEDEVCERLNIEIRYGIGGDKIQSSSWLLQ